MMRRDHDRRLRSLAPRGVRVRRAMANIGATLLLFAIFLLCLYLGAVSI